MQINLLSSALVRADQFLDYIPVASTVNNIVNIFLKHVVLPQMSPERIDSNRYYTYIDKKSFLQCSLLLIPVLNIYVAIYSYRQRARQALLEACKNLDTAEVKEALKTFPYMVGHFSGHAAYVFCEFNLFMECIKTSFDNYAHEITKLLIEHVAKTGQIGGVLKKSFFQGQHWSKEDIMKIFTHPSVSAATKVLPKKDREEILKIIKGRQDHFPTEKFWERLAQEYQEAVLTSSELKAV